MKNCKGKMEVYSRVVGFYSPVNRWNKGKREEYNMRKTFNMSLDSSELFRIIDNKLIYKHGCKPKKVIEAIKCENVEKIQQFTVNEENGSNVDIMIFLITFSDYNELFFLIDNKTIGKTEAIRRII
jgi:hypothetical protein